MKYLLGIDIGSTNLKANLYEVKGNRIAGASRHIKVHCSRAGGQERSVYNPDELWNQIVSLIQEIINQITNSKMIRGIGVTGMGEPGIPVDSNGKWIYPAITWFDQRTKSQAQWWADNFDLYKLFRITGQPLSMIPRILKIDSVLFYFITTFRTQDWNRSFPVLFGMHPRSFTSSQLLFSECTAPVFS